MIQPPPVETSRAGLAEMPAPIPRAGAPLRQTYQHLPISGATTQSQHVAAYAEMAGLPRLHSEPSRSRVPRLSTRQGAVGRAKDLVARHDRQGLLGNASLWQIALRIDEN
jgi:hypothetical protein